MCVREIIGLLNHIMPYEQQNSFLWKFVISNIKAMAAPQYILGEVTK